jgi:hypothetical protein
MGHPWVELNKWFCLQQKLKKKGGEVWLKNAGRGPQKIGDREIARDRVTGKKLAKCYGNTLCHRHGSPQRDCHNRHGIDQKMPKIENQTAQSGPAPKVLKSSAKADEKNDRRN